ncbi:hypothetical protein F7734_01195 [Scytonema sp. UIC 10036]|nr:hypothetical protein [Scytonema sp. UIC 10036]MUG91185.1 hypothetical protein [Scytonema sp. UIC 10036]
MNDLNIGGSRQFKKSGRGRRAKGESPWEKIYDWLWNDEYPNWQGKRQIV